MARKEQIYTNELYIILKKKFSYRQSPFAKFFGLTKDEKSGIISDVLVTKKIEDWCCTVSKETRKCEITCFYVDYTNIASKGPQYYIRFQVDDIKEATGRTFKITEAIASAKEWIGKKSVEELYLKFSFIDKEKRKLNEIRVAINERYPEMLDILQNEVVADFIDSYSLWFRRNRRSCRVFIYGLAQNPTYVFNWDETKIFEVSGTDENRLAGLIKKWVFDEAMPSSLITQFPEIEFGKLAEYYEKGIGIEGEFTLSWELIEDFYSKYLKDERKDRVLALIKQMRDRGFDKQLRAGQSLYTLLLSRSRRHGLRRDQASLAFSFQGTAVGFSFSAPTEVIPAAMEIRTHKGQILNFEEIGYNDTIDNLLKKLSNEAID